MMRRSFLVPLMIVVLVLAGSAPSATAATPGNAGKTLRSYAADTWKSMAAMTNPATGLVADNIRGDLSGPSTYTSPTNIGGYMWSAVVADKLGIITRKEARARVVKTLDDAGHAQAPRPVRHVLQLVRPARRLGGHDLAGGRKPGHPVSVQRGQRLACGVAAGRRGCPARVAVAGRGDPLQDELRVLLQPKCGQPRSATGA